jgi:hypothetical protein
MKAPAVMPRSISAALLALSLAACNPGSVRQGPAVEPVSPPTAPGAEGMSLDQARAVASGHSFLRPAGSDSYEVLYFDAGGRASLLRADQMKIVHGRWVAEVAQVGSAPEPIPAICLTLFTEGASGPRRCLDPKLLAADDTERVRGDPLGIAKWETVPETLPRERASLSELRERIRP